MDGEFGALKVGMNVDIQRSDGRVHSAVISGFKAKTGTITVEWFEDGETKGKEVDYDTLLNLNPSLVEAPRNISRKLPPRPQTLQNKGSSFNNSKSPTQNGYSDNNHTTLPPLNNNSVVSASPTISPPAAPLQPVAKSGTLTASRRRSNVVKEVDKIKKQREERRARQAEQKAEKYESMGQDRTHPNWEFIRMIREYRAQLEFTPITSDDPVYNQLICVAVRKRPLNKKEIGKREVDVITVPNKELIAVHEPKLKVDLTKYLENQQFRFDYAFDENSDNEIVYRFTTKPLVQTIFDGGMATCFAYGQTGSGKTHTMGGDFHGKSQDCHKGIYALATKDVFRLLKSAKFRDEDLTVTCSFFEIYSGKVFDLLNNKSKLRVLEDGKQQVQVVGLQEKKAGSVEDILNLIQRGNSVRTSGQTSANQHSSRSHAVFQINLKFRTSGRLHGKLSLIDLAGNERGADTSSSNRQTRMEGAEINKSLLALKECIRALGRRGTHLPFRASKLTQVLRDSFIGENSRTCMIAMISPGMSSCDHSLNTLRYADRVKELGVDNADSSPNGEQEIASPGDDDFALLRSRNKEELSDNLMSFHTAVSFLQRLEDEVLDTHKNITELSDKWLQKDKDLLTMANEVDYDVDVYAQQLEELLAEKVDRLSKFKEKVKSFRQQLTEEEKISRTITEDLKKYVKQ
ncbi:kinesin-like protein KIF2A isoform X1 [Tachypleus tridentatus]|uniref:kinesin-like protein KIF2A isoform X1 n=1 Tax=Tachypleus tridentatus TaxID=6853 RepID=UPI003FD2EDA1